MLINFDKTSAIPYYHQIKESLKSMIANGSLKPGDMLPSELSLSEQLEISRLVVHRAYRELVTEGLLIRKRAKGTFVSPPLKRDYNVAGPLSSTSEQLLKMGLEPANTILTQELVASGEAVAGGLQLPPGTSVIHLRNIRFASGLPFAIEDTYLPYERFPGLLKLDLNNRSLYAVLEKDYDAHPQEALDLLWVGAATKEEAALLGIHKGAPVMRVERKSTDRSGQPVEFTRSVFHAERIQFVAKMRRGE
jgi:GntR family transcriptional regulator, N-acetylglucosamine utilization regulator